MAFTQTDLDQLDAAYKVGAESARIQDREYQLRSIDEYQRLRGMMLADIESATPVSRHLYVGHTSGVR